MRAIQGTNNIFYLKQVKIKDYDRCYMANWFDLVMQDKIKHLSKQEKRNILIDKEKTFNLIYSGKIKLNINKLTECSPKQCCDAIKNVINNFKNFMC